MKDLNGEGSIGIVYEKELQKVNQSAFSIELSIEKKIWTINVEINVIRLR